MDSSRAPTFLDAAEAVLAEAQTPLRPTDIAQAISEAGLIESSGRTPAQTIKAKLSTDILKRREGSRFMRTDKNRFALRAWQDRYSEYVADRFQKALLDEDIVVFPRELLPRFVSRPGLQTLSTESTEELLVSLSPMQRREAEEDFSVVQLVSAFLVRVGNTVATYKRTKRLPESRLHGYFSLLFGGHLNPDDVPPLFSIFDPVVGPAYIQRELHEELRFPEPPDLTFVGVIYDDSREVSRQHLGVLYEATPTSAVDIEVGERGFLQQLRFETPAEVRQRISDFENWSEMVLREYLAA
jgi:predicted NUDIX family phosphoesterase